MREIRKFTNEEIEAVRSPTTTLVEAASATIEADPHPNVKGLKLLAFGVLTYEEGVFAIIPGWISREDIGHQDWFPPYWEAAFHFGTALAVERYGIAPARFPGRLAVFVGRNAASPLPAGRTRNVFIPAILVDDRLIIWGCVNNVMLATDKPACGAAIRKVLDAVEAERWGGATH